MLRSASSPLYASKNPLRSIQQALKRQKILIRYFGVPGLEDCLRISIGTRADMKTLIAALRRAVADADRERAC